MIEINNVTKRFILRKTLAQTIFHPLSKKKTVLALDSVNLQVKKGEIFALLGPNGAGKTTLIKILCSLILPDKGNIRIAGYDLKTQEGLAKSKIGLVTGEERSLYWRLSGRQNLEFFGVLYDLTKNQIKERIDNINKVLEIDDLDKPFENYSTGMKHRIALARCLISNPEIIFMDEPTKSLDPVNANKLRIFIKETLVKKLGKTVFFSTHQIDEASELADRIAIISGGKIKEYGKIEDINARQGLNKDTPLKELYLKIAG
ncbi:MAG: ABC transporter ATP-binding protein [Candidatus Omnitrophota bacterium]